MANRKRRKRKRSNRKHSRRRNFMSAAAANPRRRHRKSYRRHTSKNRRHRRRNPGLSGVMGGARTTATQVLALIGGGIATRSVPAMLLKEKNTGAMGYLANGATAVGVSMAARKFVSREAGHAALLGGLAAIGFRVFEEFLGKRLGEFAQVGPSLLGDYADSHYDLSGLSGEYADSYFAVPTISKNLITAGPGAGGPTVKQVQAVTNMAGMGKYGGKYGSKYAN